MSFTYMPTVRSNMKLRSAKYNTYTEKLVCSFHSKCHDKL